ncbi:MAG TPA: phosphatidylserine/phosphatidylglycerophosphate/cardiolipin synthase family protein [Gemmatimonadaceae bacterium]
MSSIVPLPPARTTSTRQPPGGRELSFARGLWRIAAADASSGNRVGLLHDGPRTFDTMIAEIESARESVALESYIVRDDVVGQRFADALAAAAVRGVAVRLLTDWIGCRRTSRAFWHRLRSANVEARIFGRPGPRPWLGLLPRDHRKLLVVDERVGITGGIGLGAEWLGTGGQHRRRRSRWRDTAVRIEGAAARDMMRAFEVMWQHASGTERRGSERALVRRARGAEVNPETAQGAVIGIIEGEPWRLRISRALQLQAVAAERCIWIATAYFVPSSAELEALAGAARDEVDVRVLVPSKYDHPWVRRLTQRVYRRLLRNGVRIWEWQGAMMHAKTTVIDSHWVRVGSTDFNPLGIAINYELDAVIEDPTLGRQAEEMFLQDLEMSKEIKL